MISRFDTNKDGKLDFEELQQGAKVVADKILEKYSRKKLEDLLPKTKMVLDTKGHHFHISNMKEEDLTKRLHNCPP